MFITRFSYQNKQTGWTLQKVSLDRFNLLVGASGVGKTQILNAIRDVQNLALDGQTTWPLRFDIEFQHGEASYTWEFESSFGSSSAKSTPNLRDASVHVVRETLTSSVDGVLVDRDQQRFLFRNAELPQLNRAQSALSLIDTKPVGNIRNYIVNSILHDRPHTATATVSSFVDFESTLKDVQERASDGWLAVPILSPPLKAFLLQNQHPELFDQLTDAFIEIFPSVEDIRVEVASPSIGSTAQAQERQFQFSIKERGVEQWVHADTISSGMVRTLSHLVDLLLVLKDSVVLIDEFENSLGVNCMGPLTDVILSRAPDLQFIITSHHPYIINKIPKKYWKLVRRHGSVVQVTPSSEVRALQGASAMDDFTRLINAPEFEESMS